MTKITYPSFNVPQPENAVPDFNIDRAFANAVKLFQSGQLKEADEKCRQILEINPEHFETLRLLGTIGLQAGQLQPAMQIFEKALKIKPEDPGIYTLLGMTQQQAGLLEEAGETFRKIQELQPQSHMSYFNLGMNYQARGDYDEAIEAFKKCIELNSLFADAWNNLGTSYQQREDVTNAESAFRKAIDIRPDYFLARMNLASVLILKNSTREAKSILDELHAIQPGNIDVLYLMATIYAYRNKYEMALETINQSLELVPGHEKSSLKKATILRTLNRYEEAIHCLKAVKTGNYHSFNIDAAIADLQVELGNVETALEIYDELVQQFSSLLDTDQKNESISLLIQKIKTKKLPLNIFTAIVYNRKYADLNSIEVRIISHLIDREDIPESCKEILYFTMGKVYEDCGYYSQAFENYSKGKSIKRKGIDYSPEEENQFVDSQIEYFDSKAISRLRRFSNNSAVPVFIIGMPRSGTTLVEQILSSHPQVYGAGELSYWELVRYSHLFEMIDSEEDYPSILDKLDEKNAREIIQEYLSLLQEYSADKPRVTDKLPFNYKNAGLIAGLFSNAKFIHCTRNPLDTCLSIYFQKFGHLHAYAYSLREIGLYYLQYQRLMTHWKNLLGDQILEVNYENLVNSQEKVSRGMIQFLGLDWDSKCLDFHKNKRSVRTASLQQVRQPVYTSSINRWKHYEKHIQDLIQLIGDSG